MPRTPPAGWLLAASTGAPGQPARSLAVPSERASGRMPMRELRRMPRRSALRAPGGAHDPAPSGQRAGHAPRGGPGRGTGCRS
eukprot:13841928-Alexandrium_andersonii.AAC.1